MLSRERQEKQLHDLFKIAKENNRMLRSDRNARKIKALIVLIVFFALCGYGYYFFEKYKIKIIELQEGVQNLRGHLHEAMELSRKVGDTVESFQDALKGFEAGQSVAEKQKE